MQSSQHSWFCIWWLGWFPWKRFCRSPVDFTRDLCKAVLVSQTPGAVNQGLSTSPMTREMLFWDVPSSSYPSCQLSLGFEHSLFRAGQSPFSPIRHNVYCANPREDEDSSGALWHKGDLRAARLVCPQVSSIEVFLRSCLTFSFTAWASISLHLSSAKVKTEKKCIRLFLLNL